LSLVGYFHMQKTTVPIKGMHCRSCELLIEDELTQIPGVTKAEVSEKKACAIVHYENALNAVAVETAVKKAGYDIGFNEKKPWFSKKLDDYIDIFYALFALGALYVVVSILGLTKLFVTGAGHPTNLVTVLVIGLTAGFSTCMALIGGLILGVSARFSEVHPDSTGLEKFKPHLFFNAGRILSYIFFGGIIGLLGSMFQLSGFSLGLMTLAVALVMLTLGMQLTGLFPKLENFKLTLPTSIGKLMGLKNQQNQEYSHKNAFIMGATTFFLPCGFTQAMQLYAISTGNFLAGAAIMGVFALGTAPGLLGIGGITSLIKGIFAQKFFKFAGVVVIALSVFNANNGLNLLGVSPADLLAASSNVLAATSSDTTAPRQGGVQIVKMTQSASGYTPNNFTIVKGIPVKWIINSTDPNSCASSILSSKIGVRQNLHPGENIIEFTPYETGTISFSCMMGMYRGQFKVVETEGNQQVDAVNQEVKNASDTQLAQAGGGSCGSGGCGCGGGAAKLPAADVTPQPAAQKGDTQIIKAIYTVSGDITPKVFTVKKGSKVRFEVTAKDDGYGCMSSIMIPRLTSPQLLEKDKTLVLEFTPDKIGDLPITCAMGMQRGSIKVI